MVTILKLAVNASSPTKRELPNRVISTPGHSNGLGKYAVYVAVVAMLPLLGQVGKAEDRVLREPPKTYSPRQAVDTKENKIPREAPLLYRKSPVPIPIPSPTPQPNPERWPIPKPPLPMPLPRPIPGINAARQSPMPAPPNDGRTNGPRYVELYVHGILSDGTTWEEAVRHRVQETGRQGLIYSPKGSREIEMKLYLPGQSSPQTEVLRYENNQLRDQALQRMDPLFAARQKGLDPQVIAPTMPGRGEFSWENNRKVAESWMHTLKTDNTTLDILGNSQAVPIVLEALGRTENHGLVRNFKGIDPAFGSPLPALRQGLRFVPEVGPIPGISDGLRDNRADSMALNEVFNRLHTVDPGVKITMFDTRSGVVNRSGTEEAIRILQRGGRDVTLIADPNLLYKALPPPTTLGPNSNRGFIEFNQIPEITNRGPHGAGQFLRYGNFDTLFKDMNAPSTQVSPTHSGTGGVKHALPLGDRGGIAAEVIVNPRDFAK